MIALAIETSGTVGSVALVDDARGLLAEVTYEKGLRHGQAIIPSIEQALAEAGLEKRAIDLLVAGIGPGSYTGLRVGIATAKALAYALKKPAVGAASFDALAAALPAATLEGAASLLVATDARRDRLYTGRYDPRTRARRGDFAVLPVARLLEGLAAPVLVTGAGLERYPALAAQVRYVEAHAPAREVARLGIEAWRANPGATLHDVKPLYLTPGLAGAAE